MATAALARSARNGSVPAAIDTFQLVPIAQVIVGNNVRDDVGDLEELKASIELHGILQPLRVEAGGVGVWTLKIGHRRLAAAKLAGLTHVPAIVESGHAESAADRSIQQLVENIQRRDLNPLEEARALRGILDASKGMTQDKLAAQVGRSRPAVTNLLRILDLDPKVQEKIADGSLSAAHGKALAAMPAKRQRELVTEIVAGQLSAHELERRIKLDQEAAAAKVSEAKKTEALADQAEKLLADAGAVKETAILVSNGYYAAELIKALVKRGWTAHKGYGHKRGDECDCLAFMPDLTWNGELERLASTCVSDDHNAARQTRENEAWQAKQAAAAEAEKAAAAERRRLAKPLEQYVAGDDPPFRQRLTLLALVGNDYRRANVFLTRHNPKHQTSYVNDWGPKVWGVITRLDDAKVASELRQLLASTVLEEMSSAPLRQALAKHVPGIKAAAEVTKRGTKAANG